jgi:ankyrin repeat protein
LVVFEAVPPHDPDREVQRRLVRRLVRRIVRRLLKAGAQVNLKKRRGEVTTLALAGFKPPLSLAVEAGDLVLVRLLLRRGADPNACDYFGDTALIEAAFQANPGAVRILGAAGADPNLADKKHRRTPLLWAINNHGRLPQAVPADPDTKNSRRAAARRSRKLVEALLAVGSRVEVEDRAGLTPLIACLKTGRADLLVLLLQAGADPGRRSRCGETAYDYLGKLDLDEHQRNRLQRVLVRGKERTG